MLPRNWNKTSERLERSVAARGGGKGVELRKKKRGARSGKWGDEKTLIKVSMVSRTNVCNQFL